MTLSFTACGGGGGATAGSSAASSLLPATQTAAAAASSAGPISTSGTVGAIGRSAFVLNTGSPHGNINVSTTSATTIAGGKLATGETVSVSGTGSWSTSIAAASIQIETAPPAVAAVTPAPTTTLGPVISTPAGVVSTSGTVSALTSTVMLLNQGAPHGKVDVSIPSSALKIGTGATGAYALVTGTGTVSTALTATVISYYSSAPASTTVSGTIAGGTSYGFTLDTGSATLPIVVTPATVIGGASLQAGASAQVTGLGTSTSEINAVQIVVTDPVAQIIATPTPGPIAQKHILTADYLGTPWGTTSVAYGTAAQYLTWTETGPANSTAIRAAGIKTMMYTDPNHVQADDEMYNGNQSTFAQTCGGTDITTTFDGITQYLMNAESPALWSLYASVIKSESSGSTYDAVFEDNAGVPEANGITTMPCDYSDSAWIAGEESLSAASPYKVWFNGLSGLNGESPSLTVPMASASNVDGGVFEHCYSDEGTPEQIGWLWQAIENTELEVNAENGGFLCLAGDQDSASTNAAARIYALASFLLTYNPQTNILWEQYATPSGLHVMPESGLVALNPTTAAPSSIGGLATASGVYGRQYGDCYLDGNFVGPCAIAVNSSVSSETFPYPQYTHTLTVSGAGVLDGGTVSTHGPAAPTSMASGSAVIAFP